MKTSSYFTFSATWPRAHDDVADIFLCLGDSMISRIADTEKGTNRDFFRASSTSLAFWLADNWWRLRHETINDAKLPSVDWRLRHELNSASGGALWPPAMIYSVGDRIAFAPSVGKKFVDGPQRYFDFNVSMVAASEYEQEIDHLLTAVVEHCTNMGDGKALNTLLKQINTERDDLELAAWRRLEACLGFDPDAAPDEVIDALVNLESVVGENGVEEAAHAQPGKIAAQTLESGIAATRESKVEVDLSLAEKLAATNCVDPRYSSPWKMAEATAKELRSIIGIPNGPLTITNFEDVFKVRWETLKLESATARGLPYGTRIGEESVSRIALQTKTEVDRRFELIRQLGDAVWQPHSNFGIVSRAKSDRQKFQRAFANSLLCPFDDLQQAIDVNNPTTEAMKSAARKFGVHANVVRNQLAYKGYIPFENTQDEAEAA